MRTLAAVAVLLAASIALAAPAAADAKAKPHKPKPCKPAKGHKKKPAKKPCKKPPTTTTADPAVSATTPAPATPACNTVGEKPCQGGEWIWDTANGVWMICTDGAGSVPHLCTNPGVVYECPANHQQSVC